jgi:hypothetical protein
MIGKSIGASVTFSFRLKPNVARFALGLCRTIQKQFLPSSQTHSRHAAQVFLEVQGIQPANADAEFKLDLRTLGKQAT